MTPLERRGAGVAGASLLVMAVLAGWANLVVIARAAEVSGAEYALAGVAMGVVVALDVAVGWGTWALLRGDAPRLALASGVLRVAYAGALGAAVARLAGADTQSAGAEAFHAVFDPALGLFGVHLLALAAALTTTRHAAPWLRWALAGLVALSGAGYLVDAAAGTTWAEVTFGGELALMGWLLVLAVRGRGANDGPPG